MSAGIATTITTMGGRGAVSGAGQAPYLFLALECDRPTGEGMRFRLDRISRVLIGRGPTRAAELEDDDGVRALRIRVADGRMSSNHARLERALGRWMLSDAGSKNGTFVNGERVDSVELRDGDLIEAGHAFFLFRAALPTPVELEVDDITRVDLGGAEAGMRTLVPELEHQLDRLRQVAAATVPIVITGESGTGKELIARGIHRVSARPGALVAVNCGALPEGLVESELFGHIEGAFSGAVRARPGYVRASDRGTLFLDEIGDLAPSSQVALLRALQEEQVTPVGGTEPIDVDLRVVSASHRDLEALVAEGTFREDLLARLGGFVIALPALRNRREDLGALVGAVLAGRCSLSSAAARALFAYSWPRNIRELARYLEAAVALAGEQPIDVRHLPDALHQAPAEAPELSVEDRELREEVVAALRASNGNVSAAARQLGKARQQVQRWIKRFDLRPGDYRQ
jgi:hypothetical protein